MALFWHDVIMLIGLLFTIAVFYGLYRLVRGPRQPGMLSPHQIRRPTQSRDKVESP